MAIKDIMKRAATIASIMHPATSTHESPSVSAFLDEIKDPTPKTKTDGLLQDSARSVLPEVIKRDFI